MTTEEILQQCRVSGQYVYLPDLLLDYSSEYVPVKKKLELIGGKWKGGKTSAFVFEEDPTDLLAAIQSGDQINLKKEFQFFATPERLADTLAGRAMSEHFKTHSGVPRVLEPSAGDGALVKAIHRRMADLPVDCFELMDLNRIKLAKVAGAKLIGNDFLNAVQIDTLNFIRGQYDIIVANPPFSKNQDIDHIRAMFECLRPGGTIVTMAGPSWKIGSQKKHVEFQKWLSDLGAEIMEVNAGSFKESGTMIGTLMLVIAKPAIERRMTIESVDGNSKIVDDGETLTISYKSDSLPEPQEILNGIRDTQREIDQNLNELQQLLDSTTKTNMSFFTQLAALLGQAEISLTVKAKDDNLTIMIMPKGATQLEKVKPLILSGSASDLDQEFFSTVSGSIQKISGIVSNVGEYEKNLNDAIVKTASADTAKPAKRSKAKDKDAKEEVAVEPVNESSADAETTDAATTEPATEAPAEPEVTQEELDRIAAEEAAAAEAKAKEERSAKYEATLSLANSHFGFRNFAAAKKHFIEAQEFTDEPAVLDADIAKCTEEIERSEKFLALTVKSSEFASNEDWKNAAGALKQARTLAPNPESLDGQIKEYMQKAIEAEMASESYL